MRLYSVLRVDCRGMTLFDKMISHYINIRLNLCIGRFIARMKKVISRNYNETFASWTFRAAEWSTFARLLLRKNYFPAHSDDLKIFLLSCRAYK